ncbi:family 78 glycoside hydrolase catalytic domain [Armatimonas rosea]|uniref:alpha-L-rhamnosidase n=1 Tax=Armatimonas rosea TaxID=685828 RepID=A0A7W9W5T2_ARMRO|nr:family 78 glycoside hydrolase catalytic domain [Armatimonas rosea]MBB6050779.1 hypothetical protein [Armatimonas rosea]
MMRPIELRCDDWPEPQALGIDSPQPRLSWKLEGAGTQSAYQVLVGTSPELAELWDSGRVASAETVSIDYAGKPLVSSQRVFWRVRVWEGTGQPGPWSQTAAFTMGLLSPADLKASWIVAPAATETLLLRKAFTLPGGLKRATVHVTGLGQFELLVNGQKVGENLLSPGWTNYNKTILYETFDLTERLKAGENVLGMRLGNGMYNVVRRNRFVKFTGTFGPLRALLHLRLEHVDGRVEFIGTDPSWSWHPGGTTFSNIYGGEDFDSRKEPTGWSAPGFSERDWTPAVVLIRPPGTLRGLSVSAPPLQVIETRKPLTKIHPPDGSTVYDLGQNASWVPRIRVSGPAGSTLRLTPSEVLGDDGKPNQRTMGGGDRGGTWWQYTKSTDAPEEWCPRFHYVGSRFFQAAGTAQLESLEGQLVHASAAPVGHFACSNPLLNRIRELVRWAQRSNMVSVLTDCPHREKLGWLEQYHLNGPAIRYEFDVSRHFVKGMNDMADAQDASGLIPNIAPEFTKFEGTFRAAAEWGAALLLVPLQHYHFTGDLSLIRKHYPAMQRYLAYLTSRAKDDILAEGLGDWYDQGPKKPGVAQNTPPPITATAFYSYLSRTLSQFAQLLDKREDATLYATQAERVRLAWVKSFGTHASQCAYALGFALELAVRSERERLLAALIADLERNGWATTAGDVGFRFVLRALADAGRSDVVYKLLTQESKPGYAYQLQKGATALTEAWDANTGASHNHFMLGQVTEWLYHDLAGIQPDPARPGFRHTLLKPASLLELDWVEARYDSIRGTVGLRWERSGQRLRVRATVPANTTATLLLPGRAAEPLTPGTHQREVMLHA